MVPARPVLSESCPQSLGVFSVTQAHQVSVCLLLGHLAFGDGALHVHSGMPSADVANRCVEVGGTFCGSESLCFFFGVIRPDLTILSTCSMMRSLFFCVVASLGCCG